MLRRWEGSHKSKCQPQAGRKRKSSKRSDRTLVRLSLADRKLTSKKLARRLKDNTDIEYCSSTGKIRLLEYSF